MRLQHIDFLLDESGSENGKSPFVIGLFITWRPDLWRDILQDRKRVLKLSGRLHFHKISRNENDRWFRLCNTIFDCLIKYSKSWYARFIYVGEQELKEWNRIFTNPVDVYDTLVTEFIYRFGFNVPNKNATLTLEKRTRPLNDNYIPFGLQDSLRAHPRALTGPVFTVQTLNPLEEPLLELADILTSSIRQRILPSDNPNKTILANKLDPLIGGRYPRILTWNWP